MPAGVIYIQHAAVQTGPLYLGCIKRPSARDFRAILTDIVRHFESLIDRLPNF